MKKVGILGSGMVGKTLAIGFRDLGHDVLIGTRDTNKLAEWLKDEGRGVTVGSFEEVAQQGELLVLAINGFAALEALQKIDRVSLKDKTIIDATNPIAETPPANGVLQYFTSLNDSLMEQLQRAFPEGRFVKAFSCVGYAYMVNPDFGGEKPTMFICGDDGKAKEEVTGILTQFGWETEDLGTVEAARAIEPLCMLICIPGFLRGQWNHAFKLLKA